MNGQCQAIEFLYRNGKTASEIFRLLKPKVSRSGVFKIIKRFKETGSFLPRVRNTPPRPIRTPTLIKIIKNKIKKNPKRTVRRLALEANVSRMTIHNILKKDLKLYPYKMVKRQLLTEATKKKRLERAKLLLQRLRDHSQPLVLWTDEKLFTVQAVHNPQNDRVWCENKDSVTIEQKTLFRRQKTAFVMVWAGVTSSGQKTPLVFIEEGVKINQHVYLNMLKTKVIPWMKSNFGRNGITFQQDGATSHTAKTVQDWCRKTFKGFWSKELWPPKFPRLESYGLWCMGYFREKSLL